MCFRSLSAVVARVARPLAFQVINLNEVHGAISPDAGSLQAMEMKDWGMQLPFLFINFGMAGLLGAAFNSLRMQLWKVRAAKTLHLQVSLRVNGGGGAREG